MKVNLNYEAVDGIFKSVLVDDWKSIKAELIEMKALKKQVQLPPHRLEDYKHQKKLKKAYEALIRYYFWSGEAESIIAGESEYE